MTPAVAHALATVVVGVHILFVLFVIFGGALVLRWPKVAYVHLPAVAWGIYVECAGAICPLTPAENSLRAAAGLAAYSGDFVAAYVFPVLYPDGLTRAAQLALGVVVLLLNACIYVALLRQRRSNRFAS
jgi:hypothetical protein